MALIDVLTSFCTADSTGIATAAGTNLLASQIDSEVLRDIGNGRPIYLNIVVTTAIVTGGSAGTLHFRFVSDSSAAIHATTCSIHFETPRFVTDDDPTIPAGRILCSQAIPTYDGTHGPNQAVAGTWTDTGPGAPYERYIGVQAIVTTTTITAGAVTAYLGLSPLRAWRAYPNATGA